ncbi:unnamed protein product [Gongylonema pulchrum]|uniref:glucuronosyltransferase n=1 Tax=Gongylonema pulchrum TaxID=637853 RepID=A0A183DBJ6_9BILA|nr:unnamed protein product [Gongylonema pulchrum]
MMELFQIPAHVLVSPTVVFEHCNAALGVPIVPSYIPGVFTPFTDEMSYYQRAANLFVTFLSMKWTEWIFTKQQLLFRRLYGEQFIDLNVFMHFFRYETQYLLSSITLPTATVWKFLNGSSLLTATQAERDTEAV